MLTKAADQEEGGFVSSTYGNNNYLKKIHNFIDLNSLALKCGFKSIGAVKLSIILLGFRISKTQRLSDWSSNHLTDSQKKYAAIDALICPKILDVFKKKFHGCLE